LAGALKTLPPLRQLRGRLAARAAQHQEVVPRAELLVHEQTEGAAPAPLLEARLQRPDLLHHRGESARDRELVGLDVEHAVHRLEQRRDRLQALALRLLPGGEDLVPQQRGEQERGRYALAGAHPVVCLLEGELHEALTHRLLENHVEQGQESVVQALAAQPLERSEEHTSELQSLTTPL